MSNATHPRHTAKPQVGPRGAAETGIPGAPLPATADSPGEAASRAAFDPLRLCIFATVALLGWLAGPFALVFFAGLGFVGYWRARRAGLLRSRCLLGDTRVVLAYLGLLAMAALAGIAWQVNAWLN